MDGGAKGLDFVLVKRLPLPLPLILGEHLHAIKAKTHAIVNGQMHAARDAELNAN